MGENKKQKNLDYENVLTIVQEDEAPCFDEDFDDEEVVLSLNVISSAGVKAVINDLVLRDLILYWVRLLWMRRDIMKPEIKYIQIGLENVEVIYIDVKYIEYMSLLGIADRDTISRCDKKVVRSKYCQSLHICINKKVDKKYPTYHGPSNLTVFERLSKLNDIVDITYLDGDKNIIESIYVPWSDKVADNSWFSSETNLNQSSKIDKDGNLEILVKGEQKQ